VKPLFDDLVRSSRSSRIVNHVTPTQFAQCLNVQVGVQLSRVEVDLLVEKFMSDEYAHAVNYVAFARSVNVTSAIAA
jgi:hypothetical protein